MPSPLRYTRPPSHSRDAWSRKLRALPVEDRVRRAVACIIWWDHFDRQGNGEIKADQLDDLLVSIGPNGKPVASSAYDASDDELIGALVKLGYGRDSAEKRVVKATFGSKRK